MSEISNLVKVKAVKTDVKIPIANVIEKPLTGPEAIKNNIIAAINVVIFASNIVYKALLYPFSTAFIIFDPFLISSFTLSKIRTFASTAIPIVNIIPAIPGNVRVA